MTVENIEIRGSYRDDGAQTGLQRLSDAVNKTGSSVERETSALRKNSSAQKQNTSEANQNAKAHKKAGDSSKHHAGGLGKLAAALKRILIYRAIRALIKSVTTTITEGVKRMYEWSEAHDQVFMRVMDMYATEKQYIQDATGAAVAALLQSLLPVIVQIADAFVELINKVQQFFRALAGESTWYRVDKVAAKFSTDTDKAAKAQKALNEQLMDFDKLNVIKTPKSSGSETVETPPLDGDWVDIDPKIKKFADQVKKIFEDIQDFWDSLEDSGILAALESLFSESNSATWELIKTIFDKIGNTKAGSGLATLIDGIKNFSKSGIENLTKRIDKWSEDGTIDALATDVGNILTDLSYIAGNLTDIIGDIEDIIGIKGESGSGLWLIHYILGLINGILVGVKEMLEGDIFGGLGQIIKTAIVTPLLGMVRSFAQVIEFVDKIIHPNDEEVNKKWSDFYNKLDTLEGKLNGTYTEVRTGNSELKKGSKYWATMAAAAGTSYEKLYKYAKDAYGKVTDTTMEWALEDIKAGKTVDQARKTRTTSTTNAVTTATKKIGKAWKNLFQKTDAGSEESAETFKDEYGNAFTATNGGISKVNTKLNGLFGNAKKGAENTSEYFLSEFGDATAEIKKVGSTTTKWHSNLFGSAVKNIKAETDTATSGAKKITTTYVDEFGKVQKKVVDTSNKSKKVVKDNAAAAKNNLKTIFGGFGTIAEKTVNSLKKIWGVFAKYGKEIGKSFRENYLSEIKQLNNTKVTMTPGQQGNWNSAKVTVEAKAHGGFPDMGTMFIAGEVPGQAEMVGNINGRTGVASGAEITGIADAVYNTGSQEAALLRQLIAAVRSQNLVISPSASLGRVVNQSQRLYAGVTG